jgi:hypothetical protein
MSLEITFNSIPRDSKLTYLEVTPIIRNRLAKKLSELSIELTSKVNKFIEEM